MEEEFACILPEKATFYQRVEHFIQWCKHKGMKIPDCAIHRVILYLEVQGMPYDMTLDVSSICKCPKKKTGNGRYNGPFAFTLTKSPKDNITVADMLKAVRKIMSQQSNPVIRYAWNYEDKGRDERGDPIHPHIHGMYETASGGRVEAKHFKRAWNVWDENTPMGAGFRGGYHRPVRDNEKYEDYISKQGGMSESYGLDERTE